MTVNMPLLRAVLLAAREHRFARSRDAFTPPGYTAEQVARKIERLVAGGLIVPAGAGVTLTAPGHELADAARSDFLWPLLDAAVAEGNAAALPALLRPLL